MVVFYERQFIMKEYFRILKQKVKDFWRNLRVREQWAYITALSRKIYAKAYNKINVAGTYLGQIGISANAVSWSGFVIGVFAVNFIAMDAACHFAEPLLRRFGRCHCPVDQSDRFRRFSRCDA